MKRDSTGKFVSNWKLENKQRVSVSLTSTAWRSLDAAARKQSISRSELIEYFARSLGNEPDVSSSEMTSDVKLLQARIQKQQQAIATLERQKQELEVLLENAPDAIARFDRQIRYLYVNRIVEQALGCSRDALLGTSMSEFMSDPIYLFWEEHLRQVLDTAEEREIEFEFTTPVGVRFYQARLVPELDSQGTPISVIVISRDMTDTRQAQQQHTQFIAAQEAERRVTTILESITDAFVAFDRNWHYTYVNQAAAKILHKTPEELIGKHVWQQVFPDLVGGVAYQALHRAVAQQVPVSWEEFGEPVGIWLEANGYPSAEGVALYFRDVTERKQSEAERERLLQALENQQQWLQAVLDLLPTPTLFIEPVSAKVTFSNRIANELAGGDFPKNKTLDEYPDFYYCTDANGDRIPTEKMPGVLLAQGERLENYLMNWHTPGGIRSTFCWGETLPAMYGHPAIAICMFQDVTQLKQIEENLRQTEERLQLALSSDQIVAWDMDLITNRVVCSPNALSFWGLQVGTAEEFFAVIYPEDRQKVLQAIQRATTGETFYQAEYRVITPDQTVRWLHSQGRVQQDNTGKGVRMTGVSVDITQRRQAEQEREQLLERERIARMQAETAQRQLRTIFETSPVGIALLDDQQRFVAINEALAQTNGLTQEQHLGHSVAELFGGIDPGIVAVFNEIYNTGKRFVLLSQAINAPGRSDRSPGYYNVYYLPTTNSQQQIEEVLAYVIDVTEQVKLERHQRFLAEASAVLASSLDYQTTLERVAQLAVPELADWCTVHIVQEDGAIEQIAVAHIDPAKLEWADQIREKYPLNPDEPRGVAWTLRTGKPDMVADIPDELLVQAARDPEHLEILRSVGFKSFMSVPLKTQDKIFGVISFIAAESGQSYNQNSLQLAEELARRASLAIDNAQLYRLAQSDRAKAEAANRIKDEFLAVLSHELRSPLNPILGWTKLLRSKRLNPAKAEEALETIERNAKLQAQLIEDLLDVSRILQGKMSLNIAPVNLGATIEAALETVRLAAEAKNIYIQTMLNPIVGNCTGDANRLQQVVWNLLANAVKFTPSDGRVEVLLEQVGMYAQIQVKDTGIGITPEFLPYVFEYFRQQDGATTRKFGGLGLGLAIVRHLTQLHGGTVTVNSPGQNLGATFTVRLPLNFVEQELSSDHRHLENAINLTGVQILVVDDEQDMRELAEFILTQAGAQVTTAASALEALTFFNQSVPDVLVSDIGMPEMDGYSLIRQIRQYSPQQGGTVTAIALSAYAGEINQQQALQAGFQQHIAKPIDPEDLVRKIAILISNLT